jgi:hypothetical protein
MPQQVIGIGNSANDGTGDPLRAAFSKINQNFTEIYARDAVGANFDFTNNTIASTNTNGNIELDPIGTGLVVVQDDRLVIKFSQTPVTSAGIAGDIAGMISWDSSYIYVCIGNYDGSTSIWKRAAIGGVW